MSSRPDAEHSSIPLLVAGESDDSGRAWTVYEQREPKLGKGEYFLNIAQVGQVQGPVNLAIRRAKRFTRFPILGPALN